MSDDVQTYTQACEDTVRVQNLMAAYEHWITVGYSDDSAWNMARAVWARTRQDRVEALEYVLAHTNQREEDLI